MGYIRVWIHYVWTTKSREPLMKKGTLYKITSHIRENAKSKNIYVDFINGYYEHIHCLVSLGATQTLSDVARYLKGESSQWINQNKLMRYKFEWQNEYYAVSVGHSQVDMVRNYIRNQFEHHRKKTIDEEIDNITKVYGFERFKD